MENQHTFYQHTDNIGKYLESSKIIRMYTAEGFEGGLVIVFEKDWKKGLYIMGYTELGDWVEFFSHEDNLYLTEYDIEEINKVLVDNGFDEISKTNEDEESLWE